MRRSRFLLFLACSPAMLAGPQGVLAQPPPVRVHQLAAPGHRVHGVLAGAVSAPPRRDILLLADGPTPAGVREKTCFVFSPAPGHDGPAYAPTAAYARQLPLGAVVAQCADLNGDGHDDLTYLTREGAFAFWGGETGLAPVAAPVLMRAVLVPPATDRVAPGQYLLDMTGDGRLDLLLPVAEGISLQVQDAGGHFNAEGSALLRYPVLARVYGLADQAWVTARLPRIMAADFDRNGLRDIAVLDVTGSFQFFQQADGTFRRHRLAGDLGRDAGNSFTFARFGDWNGDGYPDAALTRMEQRRVVNSTLRLHWGAATRLPTDASRTVTAPSALMFPVFLDATGDGRSELLLYQVHFGFRFAINYFLRNRILVDVAIHRLGADGRYGDEPAMRSRLSVATFRNGGEPVRVPADLDGDGRMDMAVGLSEETLAAYLGRADRIMEPDPAWTVRVAAYGIPSVADLNADGRADLLIRYPELEREHIVSLVLSESAAIAGPVPAMLR